MNELRPDLAQDASEFLAFLFTDLAGSTQLWERFPQAMSKALKRHDTILQEAIQSSGGRVVKTTGDGMMAIFPVATGGVAASLAAQRSLVSEQWPEIGTLRVRMGLHVGEAEHRGDDFFGPTVNRTARIMAAGHGGQILLSSAAAAALDGWAAGRRKPARPRGASPQGLGASRTGIPSGASCTALHLSAADRVGARRNQSPGPGRGFCRTAQRAGGHCPPLR